MPTRYAWKEVFETEVPGTFSDLSGRGRAGNLFFNPAFELTNTPVAITSKGPIVWMVPGANTEYLFDHCCPRPDLSCEQPSSFSSLSSFSGGGPGPVCCPGTGDLGATMPLTLYLTFTGEVASIGGTDTGCSAIVGTTVTLTWGGFGGFGGWDGTFSAYGNNFLVQAACDPYIQQCLDVHAYVSVNPGQCATQLYYDIPASVSIACRDYSDDCRPVLLMGQMGLYQTSIGCIACDPTDAMANPFATLTYTITE